MTHFHCSLFNHNAVGKVSLHDPMFIVGNQLRALGHKFILDLDNDVKNHGQEDANYNLRFYNMPDSYNIVVEGFTDWSINVIATAHADGARFICLATEEPTPTGFNHGRDEEMRKRQESFVRAAPYLDAIWHLVPGEYTSGWYNQQAPAAYVELGYASTLVRINDPFRPERIPRSFWQEPPFEFGFYGSMSKRRERLLTRLAKATGKRNAVRVMADFDTQLARDLRMYETKVIVQIRKFDEMGLVSSSRCNTALHLGRPVVAEPHELSKPWDSVVKFTRSEDEFIQMALLTAKRWRDAHASQMVKFKELFPPSVCLGPALALLDQPRRIAA